MELLNLFGIFYFSRLYDLSSFQQFIVRIFQIPIISVLSVTVRMFSLRYE